MNVPVKILRIHPEAQIPEYKTPGACAFDLSPVEDKVFAPGETYGLHTGLVICVPDGHTLIIAPRSSLPKKMGLIIPASIGIIDMDYCGPKDELLLVVKNFTNEPVEVKKGERLCQGLIVPIVRAQFEEVSELKSPNRGGWGSTG